MQIETSARLHLSLIDLNGSIGRVDGSIGLTLDKPSLKLECIENNTQTQIITNGLDDEYEKKILSSYMKMCDYLDIDTTYTFKINEAYPIHHGLGLGTQLSLSTASLLAHMNDVNLTNYELANIIGRGGTSGIGVYSFSEGGLIIDGGHKKTDKHSFLPSSASNVSPPPLIARYEIPDDWKIILVTPDINAGASGSNEVNIFQKYTPIKLDDVKTISYITLMKLMPAIVECDITSFGKAVNEIQKVGFKSIERKLQPPIIDTIINYMLDNGVAGAGMSSFGPTCFGITDTNTKTLKHDILDLLDGNANVIVTKGKNHGAKIKI